MVHTRERGLGDFLKFDVSSPISPLPQLFFHVFISPWVGVFIVYSAGMVCISFSTMMDAFYVSSLFLALVPNCAFLTICVLETGFLCPVLK